MVIKESILNISNENQQIAEMNIHIIERLLILLFRDYNVKPYLYTIHFPILSLNLKDDYIEYLENIDQRMSGDEIDMNLSIEYLLLLLLFV